jgi:cysteinyl-tRNA synthetase
MPHRRVEFGIRARLAEAGVLLEDTPDGTTWRLK